MTAQVAEKLCLQAAQKDLRGEARDKSILRLPLRTGSPPVPEIECWREVNASLHYSTAPLFQSLVRWSEAIERNEAYASFSAGCLEISIRI
jgi:hypothetical protein